MKIEPDESVEEEVVVRTELQRVAERQPRGRIPFGVPRTKLEVIGEILGYDLAWINDVGGRIQEALLGGYEFVRPDEIVLAVGNVVPTNKELGDRVSVIAFKKTGEKAFLMKIRKEFKEENRQMLRQMREKRLGSIVRGQTVPTDRNFYVPGHTPIKLSTKR
jgi:hypothetical protein